MRLLLEGIRVALSSLLTNKLRTFLTLLGNIVGIMAVIAVVSLLKGIDRYARVTVAAEGSNVVTVQRIDYFQAITDYEKFIRDVRHNPLITRGDVSRLRDEINVPRFVSGRVRASSRVTFNNKYLDKIKIDGNDEFYPFIDDLPILRGRHLSRLEVQSNSQSAVIGWDIYERLIKPRDPLGATIKIGKRHFHIVGVVKDLGTVLGQSKNRFCIVPIGAFAKIFGGRNSLEIRLKTDDVGMITAVVDEARVAMRNLHGLRPRDEDDFYVTTSERLVDLWRKMSNGIMLALTALVGISLLVGGVVLMNTMLVSVTERTREIGIRKALGAKRKYIIWQFLVESATLSLSGGLVGMLVGFLIAGVISALTPIPYSTAPAIVALAFALTLIIGLIFGTYPALKAALQDPVQALRYE